MELLEQILSNAPDGIAISDSQFIIRLWSPSACKITGFNDTRIIGRHVFDAFPSLKEISFDKLLQSVLNGETVNAKHIQFENPVALQKRWVKVIMSPYYDSNNKISGVMAFISNVTYMKGLEERLRKKEQDLIVQSEEFVGLTNQLKERNNDYLQINEKLRILNKELKGAKENAEESDRLKTAFLENLSHEIRTPMNAIVGFAQILENNIDCTDSNKEYTTLITQKSYELLNIIDEILEISRIELGQVKLTHEEYNLNELLDYLYTFFEKYKTRSGKENINFVLKKDFNTKGRIIFTDKFKLRQVFKYLLYNAFKFTNRGIIEFGIYEENKDFITFYVSDTGCGIEEDQFETVFEKFKQIIPANHSRDGLGLGLSIAKGLVTLLAGEIWISSEINQGTTFYFSVKTNISQPQNDQLKALDFTIPQN
jgi:PAS domain S-box-containing protein